MHADPGAAGGACAPTPDPEAAGVTPTPPAPAGTEQPGEFESRWATASASDLVLEPLSWAPPAPDPATLAPEPFAHPEPSLAELESAIDTPARAPSDYHLPPMIDWDEEMTPQHYQAVQGLQSLLWAGDFPKLAGERLMHTIVQEAKRLGDIADDPNDANDSAFKLQLHATEATLEKLYGTQRYNALRAQLSSFLADLNNKTPGGLDELFDTYGHVLATPMVMNELFSHVERLEQRKRKK